MRPTPLEPWIAAKTGGTLRRWQLDRLNETLDRARRSPFYRSRLPARVDSLEALAALPLTAAADLRAQGTGLACVPQREIARIVTLPTSGSTGAPKRIYFSEADLERTVDFFHHGLTTLVRPGDQMLIGYPCGTPGGLGALIGTALERIPARPIPHGPVTSYQAAAELLRRTGCQTLVGFPVQLLALAKYCAAQRIPCRVRAVLLSADTVTQAVRSGLRALWGCEVFEHYGMTETGLGGAVDCAAHAGLHLRENDLLAEIVDGGGRPVSDGTEGEIVITTLTRTAMPLIRLRTGDRARILPEVCPCGSPLRRLSPPRRQESGPLSLPEWDEALLPLAGLSDFRLTLAGSTVTLEAEHPDGLPLLSAQEVEEAARPLVPGGMELRIAFLQTGDRPVLHPACKRLIRREGTG